MKNLLTTVCFSFSLLACLAQNKQTKINLKGPSNGAVETIVFQDTVTKKEVTFDVQEHNPYNNLGFKNKSNSESRLRKEYDLSGYDKQQILSRFFTSSKLSKNETDQLNFKSAQTDSYVRSSEKYVVIAYHLRLFDSHNIIAMKSQVIVVNNEGKVISHLPESDQGYFGPKVTQNGKYIAFTSGDVNPETAFSLIRPTEFKVCDVESGKEIFMIANSTGSYFLSPSVFENKIIQVIGKGNGIYEYNVVVPDQQLIYKKEYSRDEVGRLLRFQDDGFVFRESSGAERLEEFHKDFKKVNF